MADSWSNAFERVINRAIGEEIGYSAFAASVGLERAWAKRNLRTGTQIEQPIFTGEDGTATMFSVHGFDTAGSSGNVTYKEPNKLVNLIIPFQNAGDTIRFSEIRMKQAAGNKTELYNYFKTQAGLFKLSFMKLLGNQFVNGNPATTSTDVHGLASIFNVASGGSAVSYQSQERTQSDALYPSIFAADATTTVYATGSASIASGARIINGTNTTFTGGSVSEGDKITLGTQTFTIRAVISATVLHVTPAASGASGTVSFTHSPQFSDTTTYGNRQVVNLAKIDKAYWDCTDGPFEPTVMLSRGDMFGAVVSRMVANQRYASQDNKVGVKKRQSFMYNNAEYFIDNYVPSGTIYGYNEEFFNCYALQGLDKIHLAEGSLQRDISTFQRASFVGEVNVSLNFSTRAPNRNFVIDGFSV
jgi:uncharacterized Zn-binding protein involved in type VI secretion